MKALAFNVMSFFLIYLPLTLMAGLFIGAFEVDGADSGAGYEVFLWFVVAIQMIGPTLLVYIASYLLLRGICRNFDPVTRRYCCIVSIGLSLPLLQAVLWQGSSFSASWVFVAVVPAAVLGGIVRFTSRLELS